MKHSRLLTSQPHPVLELIQFMVSNLNYSILGHLTKPKRFHMVFVYFLIKQDVAAADDDNLLIRKVIYNSPYDGPENNVSKKKEK